MSNSYDQGRTRHVYDRIPVDWPDRRININFLGSLMHMDMDKSGMTTYIRYDTSIYHTTWQLLRGIFFIWLLAWRSRSRHDVGGLLRTDSLHSSTCFVEEIGCDLWRCVCLPQFYRRQSPHKMRLHRTGALLSQSLPRSLTWWIMLGWSFNLSKMSSSQ